MKPLISTAANYQLPIYMSKKPTVLITGASGYVGRHLQKQLALQGYKIRTLTTKRINSNVEDCFYWDPATEEVNRNAFESLDYIIHLAGASIGTGRWTKKRKQLIIDSRVKSTKLLFKKIKLYRVPLKAFISASAIGYYGSITSDTIFDETAPAANDFLGDVCQKWETAADKFHKVGIRTVKVRTGVVLSQDAPTLRKMLLPIKLGIGSALGDGKQYMPWIHVDDLCEIYLKAIEDQSFSGAYNAVAPQHITNKEMMRTLAKTMRKPFWFPSIPAFILRLILGEKSDLLLKGSRITPKRLVENDFQFKFPELKKLTII